MISLMRTKKDFWLDKPIKRAQPLSRNRPEGVEYTLCGTFAKIYKTCPRKLYNRAHQDLHPAQSRGKNPELGRIQLKSHRLLKNAYLCSGFDTNRVSARARKLNLHEFSFDI